MAYAPPNPLHSMRGLSRQKTNAISAGICAWHNTRKGADPRRKRPGVHAAVPDEASDDDIREFREMRGR